MKSKTFWGLTAILVWGATGVAAQTIAEELRADVLRAAGLHYAQPVLASPHDTPPPAGKTPFYISHFSCPSAYYLERQEYYDDPYMTLASADSLGKLTDIGREVLCSVKQLRNEAREKTGELTEVGKQQAREMARQLTLRLPEMFTDNTFVDGRSVVENHCLLTMGEATLEISRAHQPMNMYINASRRTISWLDPQDKVLEEQRKNPDAMARYAEFTTRWAPDDQRLMRVLFNDPDYAAGIDAAALSRQLFDLAGSPQHEVSAASQHFNLFDIFTFEEIHRHWMRRNAWAYIRYGGCTLNGGQQPYIQRQPLWNLIHQGDSIMMLDYPVVHLRYTHESVVMSLVCLMGLNGYDLKTTNLDDVERRGWWSSSVFPMASNLQFIFYRRNPKDRDVLFKVLLNEQEAKLPILAVSGPYYRWTDFRRYCLNKIDRYEKRRNKETTTKTK